MNLVNAEALGEVSKKILEQKTKIAAFEEKSGYEIHGTGMPNGKVTAPVGTTYVDTAVTNGALKWIKQTGDDNTGWKVIHGDTGWVLGWKEQNGEDVTNRMYFRRINDVVHVKFEPKIGKSNFDYSANLILNSGTFGTEWNLSINGFQPIDDVFQPVYLVASEVNSSTASAENSEGAQGTGCVMIRYDYYRNSKTSLQLVIVTSELGQELNHVNPFSYLTEDDWLTTLPTIEE